MKIKYKFRPGDVLIYKPTNTPYVIIKIMDDYGPEDYKMALQNGVPGVPKHANNMRFIHYREIFNTYEPKDETIRLLYAAT